MLVATLVVGGREIVVEIFPEADRYWPVEPLVGEPVPGMIDLIRSHARIRGRLTLNGPGDDLADVRVAPPIRPLRNVMGVGKNYRAHAQEFTGSGFDSSAHHPSKAVPSDPIIFTKPPETVIASRGAIRYPPGSSDSIDYEAELGVIIGKGGRGNPSGIFLS